MSTTTAALSVTRSTLAALDLAMPPKVDKELATLAKIRDRARELAADSGDGLGAAIADALAAGTDPATDEKVRTLLARRALAPVWRVEVEADLDRRLTAALAAHADAIVAVLAPVIEAADETLEHARGLVPGLNLRDPNAIGTLAPRQLAAWGEARDAVTRVDKVGKAWVAMHRAVTGVDAVNHRALIVADLSADDVRALGHRAGPVDAAHAGARLALADFAEQRARAARVAAERAEQQEQGTPPHRAMPPRLRVKVGH